MKKVVVSAPVAIFLAGEFGVEDGKPALLTATSQRVQVTISDVKSLADNYQVTVNEIKKTRGYLQSALALIEKKYSISIENLTVTIDANMPVNFNSPTVVVATIAALTQYLGKPWSKEEINVLAFAAQKKHINNTDSIDPTVISYGGLIWYRRESDFLISRWALNFKIPHSFSSFVLIDTQKIKQAKKLTNLQAAKKETLSNHMEKITKALIQAIHDENDNHFRLALKENQHLLEKFEVISKNEKALIHEIEQHQGVAKFSKPNWILTLHRNPQKIIAMAQQHHLPSFPVQLGGEGVKLEKMIL